MDGSVSNFFSRGDKVIVCTAGKFGERWVEIAKAYGLDANVLKVPIRRHVVSPEQVAKALKAEPGVRKGVFVQASETSTGAAHDVRAHGRSGAQDRSDLRGGRHHGHRHDAARYRRLGSGRGHRRVAEGVHDPAGPGVHVHRPEGLEVHETATLPHFYFDFKKEKKNADKGESSWTPATSLILALGEALKYVKQIGMANLIENAELLAKATRSAVKELGLELFSPNVAGLLGDRRASAQGHGFGRDREGIPQPLWRRSSPTDKAR